MQTPLIPKTPRLMPKEAFFLTSDGGRRRPTKLELKDNEYFSTFLSKDHQINLQKDSLFHPTCDVTIPDVSDKIVDFSFSGKIDELLCQIRVLCFGGKKGNVNSKTKTRNWNTYKEDRAKRRNLTLRNAIFDAFEAFEVLSAKTDPVTNKMICDVFNAEFISAKLGLKLETVEKVENSDGTYELSAICKGKGGFKYQVTLLIGVQNPSIV